MLMASFPLLPLSLESFNAEGKSRPSNDGDDSPARSRQYFSGIGKSGSLLPENLGDPPALAVKHRLNAVDAAHCGRAVGLKAQLVGAPQVRQVAIGLHLHLHLMLSEDIMAAFAHCFLSSHRA